MLKVLFRKTPEVILRTDGYFNFNYEDEWLNDPLVKEMVLDVDKSEILSPNCIQSPVLGQIPPTKLSGGVKALIMMLYEEQYIVWGTSCGNNCAKWIKKIGEMKDIIVCFTHMMDFGEEDPIIEDVDTGEQGPFFAMYTISKVRREGMPESEIQKLREAYETHLGFKFKKTDK